MNMLGPTERYGYDSMQSFANKFMFCFVLLAPQVQKLGTYWIDRVLDRKETELLRTLDLHPKQQLERIVQLANAQPIVQAGLERSVNALIRLQQDCPDEISPLEAGRSLIRLVRRAVPVVLPRNDILPLNPSGRDSAFNVAGLEALCHAVIRLHTERALGSDDTVDLLVDLAHECRAGLQLPNPYTSCDLDAIDRAGRWFVARPYTSLANLSGIDDTARRNYLLRLLEIPELMTHGTFGQVLDRTTPPGADPQEQLRRLAQCLHFTGRQRPGPILLARVHGALDRCANLLRENPGIYPQVQGHRVEIRAAMLLLNGMGVAPDARIQAIVQKELDDLQTWGYRRLAKVPLDAEVCWTLKDAFGFI